MRKETSNPVFGVNKVNKFTSAWAKNGLGEKRK